jgi:hypothetical protein
MRHQAKYLVESVGALAIANGAVALAHELSIWVQLGLGIVSFIWVSIQTAKFVDTWWREHQQRLELTRKKKPPTDFGGLDAPGD